MSLLFLITSITIFLSWERILGTCVKVVGMCRKGSYHTFTDTTLRIAPLAGKSNWQSAAILSRLLAYSLAGSRRPGCISRVPLMATNVCPRQNRTPQRGRGSLPYGKPFTSSLLCYYVLGNHDATSKRRLTVIFLKKSQGDARLRAAADTRQYRRVWQYVQVCLSR